MSRGAVDRTISELGGHATAVMLADEIPERDGFLQAVSPAVKLLGLFGLIVLAVTTVALGALGALAALVAALAVVSRVPPRALARRLAVPVIGSFVVVAPRAVLEAGPAVLAFPVGSLSVTAPGIAYVGAFTLRVAVCAGLLSLALLTTRFSTVLATLRRFGAPPLSVTLLGITYRYLLVFFRELTRMSRARRSRTIERRSLRSSWRETGSFLGTFLLRTLERGERVQCAARARGGTEQTPYARPQPLGSADVAFGAVVVTAVLARVVLG